MLMLQILGWVITVCVSTLILGGTILAVESMIAEFKETWGK